MRKTMCLVSAGITIPAVGVLVLTDSFVPDEKALRAARIPCGSAATAAATTASIVGSLLPSQVIATLRTIAGPRASLRMSSSEDHGEFVRSKLMYGQTVALNCCAITRVW